MIKSGKMPSFLKFTAQNLFEKHGDDLKNFLLLFPNRRSMLFFRKALVEVAGGPIWAPQMFTFDGWIKHCSKLETPDELALILRLYKCWKATGGDESFEAFYSLGQMLLRDFDTIDESMTDKDQFFRDLRHLEGFDMESLIEIEPALRDLALALKNKEISIPITNIWKRFGDLYNAFQVDLIRDDLATPGMIYNMMADKGIVNHSESIKGVYAIGFYKLSKSEIRILKSLPNVYFFWNSLSPETSSFLDHDHPLQKMIFLEQERSTVFQSTCEEKEIEIIAAIGQWQQLQGVANYLLEMDPGKQDRVAILLSEQSQLSPLLGVIPDQIKELNVSMGLSILDTPVFSLLTRFISCLDSWKKSRLIKIESLRLLFDHDLLNLWKDGLPSELFHENSISYWTIDREWSLVPGPWKDILAPCENQKDLIIRCLQFLQLVYDKTDMELDRAAIYHLYIKLQRLSSVLNDVVDEWTISFFMTFLKRVLQHSHVTLMGEPLKGIQVLGAQEMVNLNFDHLIMMDVNEGVMPRISHHSTIPITLAQAYKLPGLQDLIMGQEYLFWSSISMSQSVTLFYNTSTEGISKADPSRFIQRLKMGLYPDHWKLRNNHMVVSSERQEINPIVIAKDERIIQQVQGWFNTQRISPTALNTWLTCRLKFYLEYVLDYRRKNEDISQLDSAQFGTIVHNTLEQFYRFFEGREILANEFSFERKKVKDILVQEYCRVCKIPLEISLEGSHQLYIKMLLISIERILYIDQQNIPFQIIKTEQKIERQIIESGYTFNFVGKIDRLDKKGGVNRIIDYKTGTLKKELLSSSYEDIWKRDGKSKKEAFQTLFYAWLYHQMYPQEGIPDILLYFSNGMDSIDDTRVTIDYNQEITTELLDKFQADLLDCINQILDLNIPFDQTSVTSNCSYCAYKDMCQR